MESVVSEDVGDELTGYPALFEPVAGFDGNGVTVGHAGCCGGDEASIFAQSSLTPAGEY